MSRPYIKTELWPTTCSRQPRKLGPYIQWTTQEARSLSLKSDFVNCQPQVARIWLITPFSNFFAYFQLKTNQRKLYIYPKQSYRMLCDCMSETSYYLNIYHLVVHVEVLFGFSLLIYLSKMYSVMSVHPAPEMSTIAGSLCTDQFIY